MTRSEIIAQLDAEIFRLERARDYLAAALKGSKGLFLSKVEIKLPATKSRKQPSAPAQAAAIVAPAATPVLAAPAVAATAEPLIKRVPPRRRVERRQAQADKLAKSPAALSGFVPAGPVAVSANEARKHERVVAAPAMPAVTELRSEIGSERTLGSLIQAFERRTGFSGAETP